MLFAASEYIYSYIPSIHKIIFKILCWAKWQLLTNYLPLCFCCSKREHPKACYILHCWRVSFAGYCKWSASYLYTAALQQICGVQPSLSCLINVYVCLALDEAYRWVSFVKQKYAGLYFVLLIYCFWTTMWFLSKMTDLAYLKFKFSWF